MKSNNNNDQNDEDDDEFGAIKLKNKEQQLEFLKNQLDVNNDHIYLRNLEIKKHVEIQARQLFSKLNQQMNVSDVNQIEKVKQTYKTTYDYFYCAFNIFNIVKNDILKVLNILKETMVLNSEIEAKFIEKSQETGKKVNINLFTLLIESIKSKISKFEEIQTECAKIMKQKLDENKLFQEQQFRMFEKLLHLIKIKDGLYRNVLQNLIQVLLITKIKMGLPFESSEDSNQSSQPFKNSMRDIIIDILLCQRNKGQIQENQFFNSDIIEDDLNIETSKQNIEKSSEIQTSKFIEYLNVFNTIYDDTVQNLIARNQKTQQLETHPDLVSDARDQVIERNKKKKKFMEKNPNGRYKPEDEDEIKSYMWIEEQAVNSRLPVQIKTSFLQPITCRMQVEQINYETQRIKTEFENNKNEFKEGTELEISKIKSRTLDQEIQNGNGKAELKRMEAQREDMVDSINFSYTQLRDFIRTIASVDDRIMPNVSFHISSLTKLSAEFINLKRNSESLPKILKMEDSKRRTIKSQRADAIKALEDTKNMAKDDMNRIKVAKSLNASKNKVADVSIQQRKDLQAMYGALKEKLENLTVKKLDMKKVLDAKTAERNLLTLKLDDVQRENVYVNDAIQQLEVQKMEMYKDKAIIDRINGDLKKECEVDNTSKYKRWREFTRTKKLSKIPDILTKIKKANNLSKKYEDMELGDHDHDQSEKDSNDAF